MKPAFNGPLTPDEAERRASCPAYYPGEPAGLVCRTDGHYLCNRCRERLGPNVPLEEAEELHSAARAAIAQDAALEATAKLEQLRVEAEMNRERLGVIGDLRAWFYKSFGGLEMRPPMYFGDRPQWVAPPWTARELLRLGAVGTDWPKCDLPLRNPLGVCR